ncbi:MAG: hypothetical protein JXX28_09885 [Deltaproteobacteria bacterium]|nr:hypothetical protein [Deltaproteobacteria bacterium]
MSPALHQALLRTRSDTMARTLYRELQRQGFTHEQVIELSAALISQVNEDLMQAEGPGEHSREL